MNTISYFEIQAGDLARARHFYATVFGWTFSRQEGLPIEYSRIETDGMAGGLMQRPAAAPPPLSGTNAFTCSIHVEEFDASAARILANGGQIAMEKFAVPGRCWQGYFLDSEGNTFGLFQPDERAA